MLTRIARNVLSLYPEFANLEDTRTPLLLPLGNAGGMSGSSLWRLSPTPGSPEFCVRCWPADYPASERLPLMHHVLRIAGQRGCSFVPVPLLTNSHESLVVTTEDGGFLSQQQALLHSANCRFWEVTPWMSGRAELVDSIHWSTLEAALIALARFHRATFDFQTRRGPVPAVLDRLQRLQRYSGGDLDRIAAMIHRTSGHRWSSVGHEVLRHYSRLSEALQAELFQAAQAEFTLQPCIRDVRPEHFLYAAAKGETHVSGLVDYGAVRLDHVAGDLARLLGSLWPRWQDAWANAIETYGKAFRPLDDREVHLVRLIDRATTLISGLNWLEWIFVEARQFESEAAIEGRLRQIVYRLQAT